MRNKLILITTLCLITFVLINCKSDKTKLEQSDVHFPIFDQFFGNTDGFSGNVLVAIEGKVIYEKSYGYANIALNVKNSSKTKFRLGSLTKQFTAMGIMILKEQRKLNTSDKITKYLSDIPKHWKDITIHQLLTHTSGLMHSWDLEEWVENMALQSSVQEVMNSFKNQSLVGVPGEKFQYSDVGYIILSSIIEKVSGESYENFLKAEVFDIIEMTNTGSEMPEKIIMNRAAGYYTDSTGTYNAPFMHMPILTGAGNMYSSVDDLLKWDQSFYKNTLISKESKEIMFSVEQNDYAYGWHIKKTDSLYSTYHIGGVPGGLARIDRYPDLGLLVVILSNNWRTTNPEIDGYFTKLVLKELKKSNYLNKSNE